MDQPKNTDEAREAQQSSELPAIRPAEVIAKVESFTRDQPHVALAGAFALGFVLGGGLTPRMLGAVAMMGARAYLQGSLAEQAGKQG